MVKYGRTETTRKENPLVHLLLTGANIFKDILLYGFFAYWMLVLAVFVIRPRDTVYLFIWWFYYLPFLEKTPLWPLYLRCFGYYKSCDCSFWQAFGRNSYNDDEMFGVISTFLDKATPDYSEDNLLEKGAYNIRTYALLEDDGFQPGKSNEEMAAEFIRLFNEHKHYGIMQWEVAYALWKIDKKFYTEHRHFIIPIWPEHEDYFATYHVKTLSVQVMRKLRLSRPLEVAHGGMLCRCIPIVLKCGARPIPYRLKKNRYDPKSVQFWTRSRFHWWPREYIGRLLVYPLKGWLSVLPPKEE